MKKLLGIVLLYAVLLSACTGKEADLRTKLSANLLVDVTAGEIREYSDDHGGFHGDGMTFVSIAFPDDSVLREIREKEGWRELPLSENLERVLYGKTYSDGKMAVTYGPLITNDSGAPRFPQVENGYYFFSDRHQKDPAPDGGYDDSLLWERNSFNFDVAVYNTDTHTLYFAAMDT